MPANIRDDAFLEQLARSIHEDYMAKAEARGETKAKNVPWDQLPKDLRDAYIAQARTGQQAQAPPRLEGLGRA